MNRNITETPEKWIVLKIENNNTFYKVFGTWAGGYLNGDRWKLNSGIERIESDEDFYYFIGYSGSCYKCHKLGYGIMTSFGRGILNKILEQSDENNKIEVLENVENWCDLLNNNKH